MRVIKNFIKYFELLKQLVIKELKVKYRRSVLGLLWSLLNPLFTMIVITLVFSNLFTFTIPNYPAYLLTGLVIWNFFAESTQVAMLSITSGASLLKKVYVPKYIFPVSKVLASFVNLIFSFLALIILIIIMKVKITIYILIAPFSIVLLLLFCIGFSLILSASCVFFRDLVHLYGVVLTAWMYATPLFYPESIIPGKYIFLLKYNPMYYLLKVFREPVFYGKLPSLNTFLVSSSISLVTFILGIFIFYKNQDKFILHI